MKNFLLFSFLLASAPCSADDWNPFLGLEGKFKGPRVLKTAARPPAPSRDVAAPARSPEILEREAAAIVLALGLSSDQTFEPDTMALREIASGLAGLRSRYPEVAALSAGPHANRLMIGILAPENQRLAVVAQQTRQGGFAVKLPSLGIKSIDDAVLSLGGRYQVTALGNTNVMIFVDFARPLDIRKMASRIKSLPGVKYAAPDRFTGGSGGINVAKAGDTWRLTFTHGWGDCPSGCINNEAWYFTIQAEQARWIGYSTREYNSGSNSYSFLIVKPASKQ